jgi:uncharacterized membrane protein
LCAVHSVAMQTKRWDIVVLAAGGLLLWVVAGGFLWRDLQVPPEAFLAIGAVIAAGLAIKKLPERLGWIGPVLLLAVSVLGGGWFVLTKAAVLVPAVLITTAATAIALFRSKPEQKGQRLLLWYGLAIAVLVSTGSTYFHLFTARWLADDVARRLILSFVWVAFGVTLVVAAVRRNEPFARDAGFAALAVAVGKILVYDMMHLGGPLRLVVLFGGGALLLGGAMLARKLPSGAPAS